MRASACIEQKVRARTGLRFVFRLPRGRARHKPSIKPTALVVLYILPREVHGEVATCEKVGLVHEPTHTCQVDGCWFASGSSVVLLKLELCHARLTTLLGLLLELLCVTTCPRCVCLYSNSKHRHPP